MVQYYYIPLISCDPSDLNIRNVWILKIFLTHCGQCRIWGAWVRERERSKIMLLKITSFPGHPQILSHSCGGVGSCLLRTVPMQLMTNFSLMLNSIATTRSIQCCPHNVMWFQLAKPCTVWTVSEWVGKNWQEVLCNHFLRFISYESYQATFEWASR